MAQSAAVISCTSCQQRKVKCDKGQPSCDNCIRHNVDCVYLPRANPPRKKRKAPEEESPEKEKENKSYPDSLRPSGKFIMDGGKQAFVENSFWNGLSEEMQGPADMHRLSQFSGRDNRHLVGGSPFEGLLNAGDLILNSEAIHSAADLTALHPEPLTIFRLWQVFLDNVNPLTKLLHAPTTQHCLLDASSHLERISKPWETFMFAMYLSAIHSMSADECQNIMGESKGVIFRRYHSASRSALLRANFTSTLDILVVQALALYILSVQQYYDQNSLWILTGAAVRLGQRIGLHRDGTLVGLPPFETEIRRRVWWRLLALDGQVGELCGAGLSVSSPRHDCKMPLNVNDSDLSPDMSAPPIELDGPTEMIYCGARFEIGLFLRRARTDSKLMGFGLNDIPVAEKDDHLDELQAIIERKYLRFCDPSVPLHCYTKIMGEAAIISLRLLARHPRKYPLGGSEMSPKEKEEIFWISMRVLEFYNLSIRTDSIQKFLWNINIQVQWHAFIILAHELQLRPEDNHTRDAWCKIEELFKHNPDVIINTNTPLHNAVRRLILKAWSARTNVPMPIPGFITTLQNQAANQDTVSPVQAVDYPSESVATEYTTSSQASIANSAIDPGGFQNGLTPNMLADGDAIDWSRWDYILQDFEFQNMSFTQI